MTETPARYTANNPVNELKNVLATPSVEQQFKNALKDQAGIFTSSIVELFSGDNSLKRCNPNLVVMEALKAATLQLPLNRNLGYAWIVPYKGRPQFQIGYKGYIQLAIRTGQYRYINADCIYEGEELQQDRITGDMEITGERKSDKVTHYFAYIELVNGFRKGLAWTTERVIEHAKKYSQSYGRKGSAWEDNFDSMAMKTVLKQLLGKYGVMSIEMQMAFSADSAEGELMKAKELMATGEEIDMGTGEVTEPEEKKANCPPVQTYEAPESELDTPPDGDDLPEEPAF